MTLADGPVSRAVLQPDVLTAALTRSAAGEGGARVTAVDVEPIGAGKVGRNLRLHLTWSTTGAGPGTVVAKLPAEDETSRQAGVSLGNYLREVRFYQEVATTVAIRTPACHLAEIDEATGDFALVLEDLAPAEVGDQVAGCTPDRAAGALEELARLHGSRWGDPRLDRTEWLTPRSEAGASMVAGLYQSLLPGFLERYGGRLPAETVDVVEGFAADIGRWLTPEAGPLTVVHGDYRLDNLLFGTRDGRVAAVDWQTVRAGAALGDASYFLGAGLVPEDRRRHERALVAGYLDVLRGAGVDLAWDDAWHQYRRQAYGGVVMAVIASMVVGGDERGDRMFCVMAERHSAHAADLDARSLVDAAAGGR